MGSLAGGARGRGQSTVEFGVSAFVLILLLVGLFDVGRSFYFDVALHGATREAARQAAWFDGDAGTNPTLFDTDAAWSGDPCQDPTPGIKQVVDCSLGKAFLPASVLRNPGTTCPTTADGNADFNPPFVESAYAGVPVNTPVLYVCYAGTPGADQATAPTDGSYWDHGAKDVNVILLMRFGSITGLLTDVIGDVHIVANTHMRVGGYPCGEAGC